MVGSFLFMIKKNVILLSLFLVACDSQHEDSIQENALSIKKTDKQKSLFSDIDNNVKPKSDTTPSAITGQPLTRQLNFVTTEKQQTNSSTSTVDRTPPNSSRVNSIPLNEPRFNPFDPEEQDKLELINDIRNAPLPGDKIRAIQAIDDYDGSRIVPIIREALNDDNSQVRIAAVKKLSEMEELHAAVEGILYALNDPDPVVILEALNAIEETSDASLIPELTPLKNHRDLSVQRKAEEIIEFLE